MEPASSSTRHRQPLHEGWSSALPCSRTAARQGIDRRPSSGCSHLRSIHLLPPRQQASSEGSCCKAQPGPLSGWSSAVPRRPPPAAACRSEVLSCRRRDGGPAEEGGVLGCVLRGRRRCHAAAQQLGEASTAAPPQDARSSGEFSCSRHGSRPAAKVVVAKHLNSLGPRAEWSSALPCRRAAARQGIVRRSSSGCSQLRRAQLPPPRQQGSSG
eukprot:378812-Alexandrium_andersonii.AAC.1